MRRAVSRRDFLKLAGLGLGALAFKPLNVKFFDRLYAPKRLPQFPASPVIGRLLGMTDVHSAPSSDSPAIATLYDDNLIEWTRETVGRAVGLTNQRFLELPQGYLWSSRVQPTRNLPNTPIAAMPPGVPGFWAR